MASKNIEKVCKIPNSVHSMSNNKMSFKRFVILTQKYNESNSSKSTVYKNAENSYTKKNKIKSMYTITNNNFIYIVEV